MIVFNNFALKLCWNIHCISISNLRSGGFRFLTPLRLISVCIGCNFSSGDMDSSTLLFNQLKVYELSFSILSAFFVFFTIISKKFSTDENRRNTPHRPRSHSSWWQALMWLNRRSTFSTWPNTSSPSLLSRKISLIFCVYLVWYCFPSK